MRRFLFLFMLTVLLISLVLTFGCSQAPVDTSKPTDKPTDKPINEPVVFDKDQVFELKYSCWSPETLSTGELALRAIDMIEERTDGKVKITPYFAGSLIDYNDTFMGLIDGLADISRMGPSHIAGSVHLNKIFDRLFEEEAPSLTGFHKVIRELVEKHPEIQSEMAEKGTIWIDVYPLPPNQLHTSKKLVKTPDDIRAMQIISSGDVIDLVENMGAAGVNLVGSEWYMAIETGLADGQMGHWQGMRGYDMLDLFQYHTLIGEGGTNGTVLGIQANLDSWNKLPPEYQQIIKESFQEATDWAVSYSEGVIKEMMDLAEEKGHVIYKLTPEERRQWAEYMAEINDKWVNETEAQGYPAQAIYDDFMRMLAEY